MTILGISAYYHDSAAAIIKNGEIIAAAQEERFTRKKHDASFPLNAIAYCLEESSIEPDQVDTIVFYDKPLLTFERLLETYYAFAPRGLASFIKSIPVWLKEKLFLKQTLRKELKKIGFDSNRKILFTEHHLSHAASAFYPSKHEKAAILTIDGVGEWATASICEGNGSQIKLLKELKFPHSLGLLYSAFTYFLGFRVNSGEYKLMGLAPYGIENDKETIRFIEIIKKELIDLKEDGSIWLNQKYFSYATGLKMVSDKKWEALFGLKKRAPEDSMNQSHCNMAFAIQAITEEVVFRMAKEAKKLTNADVLCLAGGVALNCVSNGKLIEKGLFEDVYIQPASGDAGGAIGSALAVAHMYYDEERRVVEFDGMKGSYLGPGFSEKDIEKLINKFGAEGERLPQKHLYKSTAECLSSGKIVGWMQGRMEFGPRALGARSILADPRNAEMQKKLNLNIKYRESFRPFAPAVLADDAQDYFNIQGASPYMLRVHHVKEERRCNVPSDYDNFDMRNKLYVERSDIPAITHVDFSARIQTVHKSTNPEFYDLINEFKNQTGFGVLVNTSFNVRGEPIVCVPEDAYKCFMRTEMDVLVIGQFLFKKEDQPNWSETQEWEKEFVLD